MKNTRSFYPVEEQVAGVRPSDAEPVYIKASSQHRTQARERALHPAGAERGLCAR